MNHVATLPPFPDTVAVRVAGRLGMAFFLDILRITRDGRDLLDGLILLTIAHANTEHLDREPAQRGRFDRYEDVPDDDLLRPISVSAVANSLGQPFETIRRRTMALRDVGACVVAPKGLVVPAEALTSAAARNAVFAVNQKVRGLQLDFQALGLMRVTDLNPAVFKRPRVVARGAVQYALRQLEAMSAQIEDPTVGVLLIQVIRVTTDHLDDTPTEFAETEDLVRDDLRRPASIAQLAARSGLSPETARRHLRRLQAQGWVAYGKSGYYLTREMLRAPPWPQARQENIVNLNRLFSGLAAG